MKTSTEVVIYDQSAWGVRWVLMIPDDVTALEAASLAVFLQEMTHPVLSMPRPQTWDRLQYYRLERLFERQERVKS